MPIVVLLLVDFVVVNDKYKHEQLKNEYHSINKQHCLQ